MSRVSENDNFTKVNKISSEVKRQQGIHATQERFNRQQNIIAEALKGKLVGKRTVFNSDSEDDDNKEEVDNIKNVKNAGENGIRPKLFSEDQEETIVVGNFSIKPQYEGTAGRKLLQMQTAFSDPRFKMGMQFKEDNKRRDDLETNTERNKYSEKHRDLQILQSVIGVKAVLTAKSSKQASKKERMVRFDPLVDEHKTFEVTMSQEGSDSETEVKPKTRFDNVLKSDSRVETSRITNDSAMLKDALVSSKESGVSFKISDIFKDKLDEKPCTSRSARSSEQLNNHKSLKIVANKDDSDDTSSEIELDSLESATKRNANIHSTIGSSTFFFSPNDVRFEVGRTFFFDINREMNRCSEEWKEKRIKLREVYRMRRKRALKRKKRESTQSRNNKYRKLSHMKHTIP